MSETTPTTCPACGQGAVLAAEQELASYRAAQHLPPDERDTWADARQAYRELRVHHQAHHAEADELRARAQSAEAALAASRALLARWEAWYLDEGVPGQVAQPSPFEGLLNETTAALAAASGQEPQP